MEYPNIFADNRGVWCSDQSENIAGIRWDEVYRISGYKLDTIDQVDTIIELDFEYGEFVELNSEFPGFLAAVEQFSRYISHLPMDWFLRIQQLDKEDEPVVVWQRELNR